MLCLEIIFRLVARTKIIDAHNLTAHDNNNTQKTRRKENKCSASRNEKWSQEWSILIILDYFETMMAPFPRAHTHTQRTTGSLLMFLSLLLSVCNYVRDAVVNIIYIHITFVSALSLYFIGTFTFLSFTIIIIITDNEKKEFLFHALKALHNCIWKLTFSTGISSIGAAIKIKI